MLEDSLNRSCDEGGSHDAPVDSEMLLRELKELLADKDRILDSFVHKLHIQQQQLIETTSKWEQQRASEQQYNLAELKNEGFVTEQGDRLFLVIDVTDIEEEAILKNCPGVLKLNQKCKVVKKAKDGKSEAEENHQKIMEQIQRLRVITIDRAKELSSCQVIVESQTPAPEKSFRNTLKESNANLPLRSQEQVLTETKKLDLCPPSPTPSHDCPSKLPSPGKLRLVASQVEAPMRSHHEGKTSSKNLNSSREERHDDFLYYEPTNSEIYGHQQYQQDLLHHTTLGKEQSSVHENKNIDPPPKLEMWHENVASIGKGSRNLDMTESVTIQPTATRAVLAAGPRARQRRTIRMGYN